MKPYVELNNSSNKVIFKICLDTWCQFEEKKKKKKKDYKVLIFFNKIFFLMKHRIVLQMHSQPDQASFPYFWKWKFIPRVRFEDVKRNMTAKLQTISKEEF